MRRTQQLWLAGLVLGIRLVGALPSSAATAVPLPAHVTAPTCVTTETAELAGGWRPRNMKACAFALGMSVAGVAGTLVNPIGGYIAYHIGYTMALISCT
jgi:hypothetical protein